MLTRSRALQKRREDRDQLVAAALKIIDATVPPLQKSPLLDWSRSCECHLVIYLWKGL